MAYTDYNMSGPDTSNHIGKYPANLGLTANNQTSGIYTQTILDIGDKYKIDLYGSMMTWKTEDFPLLSILYNQGTESAKPPYIVWNDEYSGTSWHDIGLDEMRLYDTAKSSGGTETLPMSGYGAVINVNDTPIPVTDANYVGGMYQFGDAAAATTSLADASTDYTNKNVSVKQNVTINGAAVSCFAIAAKDGNNRGRVTNIYNRLRDMLYSLRYEETTGGSGATAYIALNFKAGYTFNPVYFAFDDVAAYDGTVTSQFAEVLVRIEAVKFFTATPEIVIFLNAAQSNCGLSAYTHLLTYVNRAYADTTPDPDVTPFADEISHPSRMVMVGQSLEAVKPVPEGDNFVFAGGFTKHRERYENYSQIFVSPKYGITGTQQASEFRFGDEFAATREYWLNLYKGWKVGAYLRGIKAETVVRSTPGTNSVVNGQPVRALGGLLDYALFPITYIKRVLPALSSYEGSDAAKKLSLWLSNLSNSLLAFRSKGAKNITLLCSQRFCDRLDLYVRSTMNDPWMAGTIQRQAPSQLTFGLEVYTFKTSKGNQINFVHEPALDYMIEFPVAYHQFGKSVIDPKDVLLSIDTANIKQVICRPDVIEGNVQDIGQDAFFEGMRGESSFKLRFPKNHAIIYAPEE